MPERLVGGNLRYLMAEMGERFSVDHGIVTKVEEPKNTIYDPEGGSFPDGIIITTNQHAILFGGLNNPVSIDPLNDGFEIVVGRERKKPPERRSIRYVVVFPTKE